MVIIQDPQLGPRCIIIDGYNMIRQVPALLAAEAQSLAAGRGALLSQIVAHYRHTPHCVIVVFDGDGAAETVQPLRCGVRSQVIFTRHGETADEAIVRLAEQQRATWATVVVSDDAAVQHEGTRQGAAAVRVADMVRRLNAAPPHLERRARHHAAMRRIQAMDERDAEAETPARKGNGHRAPRTRRGASPPRV